MDGFVTLTCKGRKYYLIYNGFAMFSCLDRFGMAVYDILQDESQRKELYEIASILSEQGELARRYLGHRAGKKLSERECEQEDVVREKVTEAMLIGMKQELKKETELDEGLMELEKERGSSLTRAHYLKLGTVLGFGAKETMLLRPGLLLDMCSLSETKKGEQNGSESD